MQSTLTTIIYYYVLVMETNIIDHYMSVSIDGTYVNIYHYTSVYGAVTNVKFHSLLVYDTVTYAKAF